MTVSPHAGAEEAIYRWSGGIIALRENYEFNYIHDNDVIVNAVVQSSMLRIEPSITPTILKKAVEIVYGDV